jgi:hypothetical protein
VLGFGNAAMRDQPAGTSLMDQLSLALDKMAIRLTSRAYRLAGGEEMEQEILHIVEGARSRLDST